MSNDEQIELGEVYRAVEVARRQAPDKFLPGGKTSLKFAEEVLADLQKNQFASWGQILRSGRAGTSHRGLNDRVRAVVRAMVEVYRF